MVLHPGDLARKASQNYVAKLKADTKASARRRRGSKHATGMTQPTTTARSAASRKRDRAAQRSRRRNR